MARSRLDLDAILRALPGVVKVYFQAPTTLEYPCIIYELDEDYVAHADNINYWHKNRYTVTVIDRNADSLIPDMVRDLPYSRIDRKFVTENQHHTAFQLYF